MKKEIISVVDDTETTTSITEEIDIFNEPIKGDLTVTGQIRAKGEGGVGVFNPSDEDASAYLGFFGYGEEDTVARIRLRGDGAGANGPFQIQGPSDSVRMSVEQDGTTINGTLNVKEAVTAPNFLGTATTATRLQVPRRINGVSFDGTADITFPTTGGNAETATKLQSARTIALSGGVTGSTTFDGSANATISATVVPNGHAHTWDSITGRPATFPSASHTHNASDINAGTLNIGRIPIGTTATTVSQGDHRHANATTNADGFMSSTDKTKLDGIANNANHFVHPTGDGNLHVPTTGTSNSGRFLRAGGIAGSLSWANMSWADLTDRPTTLPPSAHTHNANEINAGTLQVDRVPNLPADRISSGILNVDRIPRGTGANQVAVGNHTHTWDSITSRPSAFPPDTHTHAWTNITDRPSIPTASTTVPLIAGTGSVGTNATFARADHVHPAQTTITGNAGTATRLQNLRAISLSGGATGSANFDGSANTSITVTIPPTGHIHGFDQLRGVARFLSQETDLNTIFEGGIYRVETPVNGPGGDGTWWYVQVIQQGTAESLQIAWSAETPNKTWIRSAWRDQPWSAWMRPDAARADRLATPRQINGVNFDGSENITLPPQTTVTGNAGSATRLQNSRTINGTSFNGTESITTANWGAARTITLAGAITGSASINGSQNVTINTSYGNARMSNIDGLDISLNEFHEFIYEKLISKEELSKYVEEKRAKGKQTTPHNIKLEELKMENIQTNEQQLNYGDLIIEEMVTQHAELLKQISFLKVDNKLLVKENTRLYGLSKENQHDSEVEL